VVRTVFLLTPLISVYIGISPVVATLPEIVYYFVPFMLLSIAVFGWAAEYHVSFFWSEVYETILCFPSLQRVLFTLRTPFGKAFVVTRKGIKVETKNYNLRHTWPLLVLIALIGVVICLHLVGYSLGVWQTMASAKSGLMIFWLGYNAVLMSVAVLSAIDQPVRRMVDRYPLRTACKLRMGDRTYWGHTNNLSEAGASLTLTTDNFVAGNQLAVLEFLEHDFSIEAQVCRSTLQENYSKVALKFPKVTTEQNRQLVTLLYTNMTWWKQSKRSGGLDSLLAMLSAFFKLKPVLSKYVR
jgi:cellulose synthase (UDP-forming)